MFSDIFEWRFLLLRMYWELFDWRRLFWEVLVEKQIKSKCRGESNHMVNSWKKKKDEKNLKNVEYIIFS